MGLPKGGANWYLKSLNAMKLMQMANWSPKHKFRETEQKGRDPRPEDLPTLSDD